MKWKRRVLGKEDEDDESLGMRNPTCNGLLDGLEARRKKRR